MRNNTAVCSAQKTGGLFDALGVEKLATLADKDELEADLWEGIDLSSCTTNETSGIIFDENSLDQFMDLSQFLTQDSTEFAEVLEAGVIEDICVPCIEPIQLTEPIPPTEPIRKRKSSVIEDHDYVAKKARAVSPKVDEEVVAGPSIAYEDKYKERRVKNNIASRRSRETRKRKFVDMESEADKLEVENQKLEERIIEMERLAKEMKAVLVKCLVDKK